MSKLLEILGRGIAVNTTGLLWFWIDAVTKDKSEFEQIGGILNLISLGSFDIAEDEAIQYLRGKPDCTIGRMAATAICLENSDLAGAVENLQSIYYRQPNNTIALYALGHCYERLGKEAEATEFYQDCLKFKNYLELPRLRLAAIYFKNGQVEQAITEYIRQRNEHPDDIETLVLLGHLFMQNGNYEAAVDAFNSAILIHPDNFAIPLEEEKINELIETGGHSQAIEYLNGLIEEQPESAELHLQLGDLFADEGNVEESMVQYEKAVRLQPSFLQGFVKLGSLHLAKGNIIAAAELFNKAVAINDEIVDAYFGLAAAQRKAGDENAAYSTLILGATIQQNSCILFAEAARLRYCATARVESIDSPEAQNSFSVMFQTVKQQCSLNPDNQSLLYAQGLLYMRMNKFKEASESFREVIRKNPTHYRALSGLSLCYAERGEKAKALIYLAAENKISPELLNLHYKTSLLYCSRSNFIEALNTTRQRLDENFDSLNAITTISEVLQNMGLIDRAFAGWNLISDMVNHAVGG
ncbi:MAG: tetratricopeptide repeat protein [Sedimentisphaerales bacterium]